jgi:hypothetical protein
VNRGSISGVPRVVVHLREAEEGEYLKADLFSHIPEPHASNFTEDMISAISNSTATYYLMYMAQWGLAVWQD